MKIVVFAANGYIGKVLSKYYAEKDAEVLAITRRPTVFPKGVKNLIWDGKTLENSWAESLEGSDMIINLAGKSVNCRYNEKNKREIFDSRVFATQVIENAIQKCMNPPKLWVNSASATIYRHAEDRAMDEDNGEIGSGFSVEVCKKWEKTFFDTNTPVTRKVALRMAIVLGKDEGVFIRLQNLVKYGLGGKQGNGCQMFSWIHEHDLCRLLDFLIANKEISGTYNASAPGPVSNTQIMKTIRMTMKMPFGLPAPMWLLELGAILIGTETEFILKSRWVIPTKLLNAGFKFQFPDIKSTVENIIKTQKI